MPCTLDALRDDIKKATLEDLEEYFGDTLKKFKIQDVTICEMSEDSGEQPGSYEVSTTLQVEKALLTQEEIDQLNSQLDEEDNIDADLVSITSVFVFEPETATA